jgi:hypothetical protein
MPKSVRSFLSLFLVLQLILPYSVFAAKTGEFKSITGDVRQTRAKVVITPVTDSPILPKDVITTEKASSATMAFPDESIIKLEQNSKLEIMEFLFKEKSRTAVFFLSVGKVAAKVNSYIGGDNVFEVQSPTAIVGVRGTGFEFDEAVNAENKNVATVSCTEGSLNLSALSPEKKVISTAILYAGQMAVIIGGVITVSAIIGAVGAAGAGSSSATATSTATTTTVTTSTKAATTTAATTTAAAAGAGLSSATIVGVAGAVAGVGAVGAAASSGGGGGSSSSTTTSSTPAPAPTSSATYDATGTWNTADTYVYNNCGDPVTYETSTVTITQTGDTWTDNEFYYGTVNGATYTANASYPEDGGTTTSRIIWTLSSSTSGTYTDTWSWTNGTNSCSGEGSGTTTKVP